MNYYLGLYPTYFPYKLILFICTRSREYKWDNVDIYRLHGDSPIESNKPSKYHVFDTNKKGLNNKFQESFPPNWWH